MEHKQIRKRIAKYRIRKSFDSVGHSQIYRIRLVNLGSTSTLKCFLISIIKNNDNNKMMIFCAGWANILLQTTQGIFIDITFKKAPYPFKQVYVVMAEAAFCRAVPVTDEMTERTEFAFATLFNYLSQYIEAKLPCQRRLQVRVNIGN